MDKSSEHNVATNVIIDLYLKNFEKRLKNKESFKSVFFAKFSAFLYVFMIIKYGLNLFIPMSNEMKLYLFDLSVILGGVPKYNTIYLICVWVLGLFMNFKLHFSKDQNFIEFSLAFGLISGRNRMILVLFNEANNKIVDKLIRFARFNYKLFNYACIQFGKFFP